MKWIKKLGIIFGVLYLLVCVALYFVQAQIIFRPHSLPESHVFRAGEEVEIEVEEGLSLNCLWVKESRSKGVILYLHGNRGNNRRCLYQARTMAGNGYDIFMPDYRGFGKSEGQNCCEEQLYADVQKVYDFLKQHYSENQIVLAGYSLGSGIASYIAANNDPQQLFLMAPYLSITDLKDRRLPILPDFLLKFPLATEDRIEAINCPITLFHGTRDEIIPYDSSEKLKALNPDKIQLVTLEGTGHRKTIFHHRVENGVRNFLK